MNTQNVKVIKRWSSKKDCSVGHRFFASGVCNGKKFKAERKWKGWNSYQSSWVVDDRFNMNERRAIGRAIGKD